MSTKILYVLGGLGAGGTEHYLLRLLRFQRLRGRWPDLESDIVYNARLDTLAPEFRDTGARLIPFPSGNPARSLRFLPDLLKRERYDALCCLTFPMFLPLLHARHRGIPVRIAFLRVRPGPDSLIGRNLIPGLPLNAWVARGVVSAERRFLPRYATHLWSNSRGAIDALWPEDRRPQTMPIRIIRNGIDFPADDSDPKTTALKTAALKRELGIPDGLKVVGHVAAFRIQKNHRLAVRVAETICDRHDDVFFAFFGEGTREGVPTLLRNTKHVERIRAFGYRNDLFDLLRLTDIFLLPSFSEGQSNALLEAMGMGVPFLVSAIPENLEVLPEGFRDAVLPPNDDRAYVERIEEMLHAPWDEARRQTIRQAARSWSDPERNFAEVLDLLNGVDPRRLCSKEKSPGDCG